MVWCDVVLYNVWNSQLQCKPHKSRPLLDGAISDQSEKTKENTHVEDMPKNKTEERRSDAYSLQIGPILVVHIRAGGSRTGSRNRRILFLVLQSIQQRKLHEQSASSINNTARNSCRTNKADTRCSDEQPSAHLLDGQIRQQVSRSTPFAQRWGWASIGRVSLLAVASLL
jgi:hypothetical protein